ncbi:hypothetical protein B0H14DRAFT_3518542 [Mycena olivaceomarginata]|nr:hypothetical protein B0H14DRAFT_3518542 [Mycena olivaceomarginata]
MPADQSGGRTGRKAAAGSKRGAATDSDYDDDVFQDDLNEFKNPGKPDMPRSQRSHEEVEAEKASKAQATADAAQKYNDAIALIAAHEAQQKERCCSGRSQCWHQTVPVTLRVYGGRNYGYAPVPSKILGDLQTGRAHGTGVGRNTAPRNRAFTA